MMGKGVDRPQRKLLLCCCLKIMKTSTLLKTTNLDRTHHFGGLETLIVQVTPAWICIETTHIPPLRVTKRIPARQSKARAAPRIGFGPCRHACGRRKNGTDVEALATNVNSKCVSNDTPFDTQCNQSSRVEKNASKLILFEAQPLSGGVMMPDDIDDKSANPVSKVLHPAARKPDNLPVFAECPELVDLDITDETVDDDITEETMSTRPVNSKVPTD